MKPTGKTKSIELEGKLIAYSGDWPVVVRFHGEDEGPAVLVFSTKEKLVYALREADVRYTNIKQITDGPEFLRSIPPEIRVMLDPHTTETGRLRFFLIPRNSDADEA